MPALIPILIVVAVLLLAIYSIYASLIRSRNKVQEAFSGIDVQLKKRHDLIPNILAIAKRFMEHESGLMTEITELRTKVTKEVDPKDAKAVKEQLGNEAVLQGKMSQLMVAVENYPNLKSDQTMIQAQMTYNEVEEHIAAARRFYNAASLQLKNSVEIFPSSWIASWLKIAAYPFFEANEAERKEVNAAELL